MKHAVLIAALCMPLAACNKGAPASNQAAVAPIPDAASAISAIKAAEAEIRAGFKAKDAKRIAAVYASDAEIMVPFEAARGVDGVQRDLDDPMFNIDFAATKTDVAASADLGYTRGTFTVTFTNKQTGRPDSMIGNYVTIFKKQPDGAWKAVQDISTPGPTGI